MSDTLYKWTKRRCAVVGCELKTKRNFFLVPRSVEKRALWEAGLEMSLKEQDRVCVAHFADKDLKQDLAFYRKDGSLLDKVPLQRTRLHKDAVPFKYLFQDEDQRGNSPQSPPDIGDDPLKITNEPNDETLPVPDEPIKFEALPITVMLKEEPQESILSMLTCQPLQLPKLWTTITPSDLDCLVYAKFCLNKDFGVVPEREVCVRNNGSITCRCHGKPIQGLEETFSSAESLLNTINMLDSFKICKGLILGDNMGIKRHRMCSF